MINKLADQKKFKESNMQNGRDTTVLVTAGIIEPLTLMKDGRGNANDYAATRRVASGVVWAGTQLKDQ